MKLSYAFLGPDKTGYYHELFLRGKRFLATNIKRKTVKRKQSGKCKLTAKEPNFYLLPFLPLNDVQSGSIATIDNISQQLAVVESVPKSNESNKKRHIQHQRRNHSFPSRYQQENHVINPPDSFGRMMQAHNLYNMVDNGQMIISHNTPTSTRTCFELPDLDFLPHRSAYSSIQRSPSIQLSIQNVQERRDMNPILQFPSNTCYFGPI